jgi:cation diffusion facilitator family transporter
LSEAPQITVARRIVEAHGRGMRFAVAGVAVNAALVIVKLVAGLLGHSYALVADAVESMADILGSIVVWSGLYIASQPADKEHPYGHGKAEPLAALVVGFLLIGAGIGIAIEAIREIATPHHAPAPFTLIVLIAVFFVKETLYRIGRRTGRRIGSGAVALDAWHHRGDALTSLAAAIGISVALIGGPGYEPADDWAALFATGVIFWNAARLVRGPVRELMDIEAPHVVADASAVARQTRGVQDVEKVMARKIGLGYWVDMHVEVDPQMPVIEAHRIAHDVKDQVLKRLPHVQDVLIHIEPHASRDIPAAP